MNFKTCTFFICILVFGFISCSPPAEEKAPAVDLAQIKSEIQAMEDAFAAGLLAKDAEAVGVYYADDAMNMPANAPVVRGKAAIVNRLRENIAKDSTGTTSVFEVQEIIPAGDLIIEIGKSTETDADGNKIIGKWMSIFEKREGKYVCIRDIWNNDAPDKTE